MANKKISELPLINSLSGSQIGGTVIPVVVAGTTAQISAENFSRFMNAYAAQTGSAGNTFTGPQTIQSTLSVSGNTNVGGNLVVAGKLTAEEFYTTITTSSVLYQSGSTKFGNSFDDKHEFTGSINVSGSLIYNGVTLLNLDANTISRLQQTTASLQTFTASQDSRNFTLSQVTASFAGEIGGLEAYSASLKAAAIVSSSTQIQNYDVFALNSVLYIATGSIKGEIAGIEAYTASLKSVSVISGSSQLPEIGGLEAYTASLKAAAIVSSSTQVQNYDVFALNSVMYIATGSIKGEIAGIEAYTASLKAQAIVSSSTQVQNYDVFALNSNLYTSTGSLIGITNGLMAFTAALDATYATDAQLYELYQATASLNTTTGSIKGEIAGIEAYTASLKGQAIVSSSTQIQNYDLFALNSNLYISTGSLIGITNGLMAFTAALDNTYATDAQLYELYQATASLNTTTGSIKDELAGIEAYTASLKGQAIVSSSTQIQNYDVFALNSNLYNGTGSIKGEIAGIEAYTASLKSQAIVSSSTQVQNYDVFALNSNLYTSTGSIKGEIAGIEAYTSSLKAAISVSGTNVQIIGDLNVNKLNVQYISSSVLVTSGSNIFGDQSTDKHEFTGSVYLENSLILGTEVLGNAGLNSLSSSLIGITNELMALTASMKAQAIVSSSQQIQNYNLFAVTSSANTFYGNQTINGTLGVSIGGSTELNVQQTGVTLGNVVTDMHMVTGSVNITGSLNVVGNSLFTQLIQFTGPTAGNSAYYGNDRLDVYGNNDYNISLSNAASLNIKALGTGNIIFRTGTTNKAQFHNSTGNLTLQNGGTFTDNGSRLQIIGSGSQNALYVSGSSSFTGSLNVSGSSHTIQNGYVILQQVSQSLNFVDDTAAAAGGVPLGGLYRNGNFIVIRIV